MSEVGAATPVEQLRVAVVEPADRRAVLGLAVRLVYRGTVIVALVAGGLSAFVVVQYRVTFAGTMDTASLTALAANPAIRSLFGPPVALDDAGGFTVWRTGTPVAMLVASWALLMTTRIMRGEEDAGRWSLLLAGRIRLDELVARHLAVALTAQLVVGAALAAGMLLAGTRPTGAVLHAATVTLVGMVFAAVGALCAQLVAERRLAAGLAGSVLVMSLLARMIADGADRLSWLAWATPLGLMSRVQPYAADRLLPLLSLAAMLAVLAVLTIGAARGRDHEAGTWDLTRATRPPRLFWVRSLELFATRRAARGLAGWSLGLAAYFALVGSLASSMTDFLADNPQFAELAAQAGVTGLATVEGYAAALIGLLPLPVGIYAAARISADAADEGAGRFTSVFACPVSRRRWALVHASVVTVSCIVLVTVAGVALWAGARTASAPLGLLPTLAGTLNTIPVALVCLGAALLALGWAPRAVLAIGATPAAGGYLLFVLAETFGAPGWVRALSPFAHLGDVPVSSVDLPGTAILLLGALVLGGIGILGYARRDLTG